MSSTSFWDSLIPFDGELLTRYERRGLEISGGWAVDVGNLLTYFGYEGRPVELPNKCLRYDIDVDGPACLRCNHITFRTGRGIFHIYESPARNDPACIYGVLLESANRDPARMGPRDFYARLILHSLTHLPLVPLQMATSTEHLVTATRIAALFERELLLSATSRKGWNETGINTFVQKATFWIERQSKVKMALPAFPCKTTSKDKAAASVPDGGEFEALANLLKFCQHVEEIYDPGCDLYIVSDGHVFSDCIGTDDDTVTIYSQKLRNMLTEVERHYPVKRGGIKFFDLEVLLQLETDANKALLGWNSKQGFCDDTTIPQVNHPVTTQIDPRNDFCRRVLMLFFSPPMTFVRDLLKDQPQHSLTALYRGFSRFMFEDLAFHPDFKNQSNSQRKKAAEEVAREMICRNQAYSRLVERVLPMHIRLSIHAHDSAGPKFPVQLLVCRPVDEKSLDLVKTFKTPEISQDFLHIPTPWHNTMADVYFDLDDGRGGLGVGTVTGKASSLLQASQTLIGGYDRNHPRGGRFVLWLDPESLSKSVDLIDKSVAVPEIAVSNKDLRLNEQYDYTRPWSNPNKSDC